ncbi:hypothetical protein CPC16_007351 [Podila verticillata]|nr:hypothetical protein CPC16_007351 [Podila verticillata]
MAIICRCIHRYNDENDDSSSCILKFKKQEQDTCTVAVNNLHLITTVDDLKWALKDFGRIYSARISCTFGSKHSRGNGHAFLEFRDIETMVQATNMNGTIVQSRAIQVALKNANTVDIVKGPKNNGYGRHGHGHGYSQRHGRGYGQRQGYGRGFGAGKTSGHGYGHAFGRDILNVGQGHHGHSTLCQGS